MRRSPLLVAMLLGTSMLANCQTNYADLPTFSAERKLLQVVIEMPAGTNYEQRYTPETNDFQTLQQAGANQLIEFLPTPGNLGFVPGTQAPTTSSATTAKPLAALVLAESQPSGTVLEVLPIGLLMLDIHGNLEQVVITVPARPAQRILPDVTDWATLIRRYPDVRQSLSLWFQHRTRETHIVGWKDEKSADQQIRKWLK